MDSTMLPPTTTTTTVKPTSNVESYLLKQVHGINSWELWTMKVESSCFTLAVVPDKLLGRGTRLECSTAAKVLGGHIDVIEPLLDTETK